MEHLEKVAACLENHPNPSDLAQQKTLDHNTKYMSQVRIAGDLAAEALRFADTDPLAGAKERVNISKNFYP